jgi:putative oxidoreductase
MDAPSIFPLPRRSALLILRLVVAAIFVSHSLARMYQGTVDDFGLFLDSKGFQVGFYLAWGITLFELIGGLLLGAGLFCAPLSIVFSIQLIFGIVLVHGQNGWFVVGSGTNGVEYSVLLIFALLTVGSKAP